MGTRWVAPRGWDIELINLDGRWRFRARQYGCLAKYCRSVPELEEVLASGRISMADLVEVLPTVRT